MEIEQSVSMPSAAPPVPTVTAEDVKTAEGAKVQGTTNIAGASSTAPQAEGTQGAKPEGDTSGATTEQEGGDPTEEVKDEGQVSARFAALNKKEKALTVKEKEISEKAKRYEPIIEAMANFKENPLAALDAMEADGFTFEMLAQAYIDRQNGKPTTQTEDDKLKALQDRLDAMDREKEENAARAEQERLEKQVNDFKKQISTYVEAGGEKYELIQANNALDVVYNVIEAHYEQTQEILPIDKAADQVEDYLFEEAKRLLNVKKLGYQPPAPAPEPAKPQTVAEAIAAKPQAQPSATTLSAYSTPPASDAVPEQVFLPKEDSVRKAAQKLRWT